MKTLRRALAVVGTLTLVVCILGYTGIASNSMSYMLRVAQREFDWIQFVNILGNNPQIDTGDIPEDAWPLGSPYEWSETADITTVSSSSDADSDLDMLVDGLDASWNTVTQVVTLKGQDKVTLDTPLIRVNFKANWDDEDFTGTIYTYVDGDITAGVPDDLETVRSVIQGAVNSSTQCIYTVPAGFTAYLYQGYVSISRKQATVIEVSLHPRFYGKVFWTTGMISLSTTGSGWWNYIYSVPVRLPEKSDVKITIQDTSASAAGMSCGFDIVLIKN